MPIVRENLTRYIFSLAKPLNMKNAPVTLGFDSGDTSVFLPALRKAICPLVVLGTIHIGCGARSCLTRTCQNNKNASVRECNTVRSLCRRAGRYGWIEQLWRLYVIYGQYLDRKSTFRASVKARTTLERLITNTLLKHILWESINIISFCRWLCDNLIGSNIESICMGIFVMKFYQNFSVWPTKCWKSDHG